MRNIILRIFKEYLEVYFMPICIQHLLKINLAFLQCLQVLQRHQYPFKQQINHRLTYPTPFVRRGYLHFTLISSRR